MLPSPVQRHDPICTRLRPLLIPYGEARTKKHPLMSGDVENSFRIEGVLLFRSLPHKNWMGWMNRHLDTYQLIIILRKIPEFLHPDWVTAIVHWVWFLQPLAVSSSLHRCSAVLGPSWCWSLEVVLAGSVYPDASLGCMSVVGTLRVVTCASVSRAGN